jgi:hypothetical protein
MSDRPFGPPCPVCLSIDTEPALSAKADNVPAYACLECGLVWREAAPPLPTPSALDLDVALPSCPDCHKAADIEEELSRGSLRFVCRLCGKAWSVSARWESHRHGRYLRHDSL